MFPDMKEKRICIFYEPRLLACGINTRQESEKNLYGSCKKARVLI